MIDSKEESLHWVGNETQEFNVYITIKFPLLEIDYFQIDV